jgi:hypothetical protein
VYGIALALLGALTLFLALAVLGSMRETVILRVEVEALSQLITSPPPPSFIGGPAPGDLRRLLESIEPMWTDPGSSLVAFVTPGCRPCDDVATELSRAAAEGQIREDDLLFVVWASETNEVRRFAARLPGRTIIDSDGDLARTCEVRATPTFLIVSRNDFTVLDFNAEGGVEWILERLVPNVAAPTTR